MIISYMHLRCKDCKRLACTYCGSHLDLEGVEAVEIDESYLLFCSDICIERQVDYWTTFLRVEARRLGAKAPSFDAFEKFR